MKNGKAQLQISEHNEIIKFDIKKPVLGTPVIDISQLGSQGYYTYDPGFTATAACESKITYIDGDEGVLLYRGYPIQELASHKTYLEVCYLLLNGELPSKKENIEFVNLV